MPPATGGLPQEPSDDSDDAGHTPADDTTAERPAADGRGIVIPPARRSPDDYPADYPRLTGRHERAHAARGPGDRAPGDRAASGQATGAHPVPIRPASPLLATAALFTTPPAATRPAGRASVDRVVDLPAKPRPLDTGRPVRAAEAAFAAGGTGALIGVGQPVGKETTAKTTPSPPAASCGADDSGTGTSDRRQFHRIAGAVIGALLIEGQILEVSGMLAASPVQLALDRAEHILTQALGAHEIIPPAHILAQTARLHRGLERLARRRMPDSQWRRLRLLAGRVAVLRADAAFKQGNVTAARVLTAQGYAAGLAAGDGPLCGSAREVGAVTEFYDGRPDEALRLARDGQRHVGSGPVRARLVCQEARALAALGDVQGAAKALDQAYDLADQISPDRWGRPGPSFDEFNPVEVAYNATTALCLLGRPRTAEQHAELALPKLDAMDAPGFRSVIRLDLSLALARAGRLELERVCHLASEAIQISWGRTVSSVSSRADQLLEATRVHGEVPEVRDLAALVREWQRSAAQQSPAAGLATTQLSTGQLAGAAIVAAGGVTLAKAAGRTTKAATKMITSGDTEPGLTHPEASD
ncbi:hypothetical protein [Pseudofrankia inefficax]|uniref:Uncharacterized protein n=1 Tax=Pseudofrankia inefficax (strain DSM 45817 / CECT 9037 / DDB 130130 / EuI1c) TaxID=298654 RepID=E3J3J9_PSEI1|nr:hypothetical protein [Pseudofrankia inefficax]ADP78201.1 hypothetical protein FraEuI1c_0113 [Pseudofrankia inefficax]